MAALTAVAINTRGIMEEMVIDHTNSGVIQKKAWRESNIYRFFKNLDRKVVLAVLVIVGVNCTVWAAIGVVLHYHPALSGTAVLAYTLGLRHALDADHISAIDLMTRKLIADGQTPVTVGTFFSLGHSTIVIITSLVVAATSAAVYKDFDRFSHIGGIVGTSISASFLLILAGLNAWVLYQLVIRLRKILRCGNTSEEGQGVFQFEGGGILFRLFRKLFKLIDRPWKMYPLGVLFGLGFDTSTEIALLGITSIQGAKGTSFWLILIFPVLFTSGMCLLDTLDGIFMLLAYTSAFTTSASSSDTSVNSQDPIPTLYYSILLTTLTIFVAIIIATIQFLTLALNIRTPTNDSDEQHLNKFWTGVVAAGDHFDIIGGSIVGMFILTGILGVVFYKPWRHWVDRRHFRPSIIHRSDDDNKDRIQVNVDRLQRRDGKDDNDIIVDIQMADQGIISRKQRVVGGEAITIQTAV